ncbi:CRISPR-associated endonuclease Cas2 [Patescibacteria group bacterium]|nr:CRISPR-associated endonuclease Cas2 [Patescibacteria group bacterium]
MTKEGSKLNLTTVLLNLIALAGQAGFNYINFFYDIKRYGYLRTLPSGADYVAEIKQFQKERQLKETLRQLQRSKYIKSQKIGKNLIYKISDKGLFKLLTCQLNQAPKMAKNYTIVIFDIPKTQNPARRHLRWLLRRGGFKMLQQSVWLSQKDNYNLLKKFIKENNLDSWVNILYADKILNLPKSIYK